VQGESTLFLIWICSLPALINHNTGAMRLRQLKTTQRVTFFAPLEVHQSILDLRGKADGAPIDSFDVYALLSSPKILLILTSLSADRITWLIHNTCEAVEELQPLYYAQGVEFCRRMQALSDNTGYLTDDYCRRDLIGAIRKDEQESLQMMYEPRPMTRDRGLHGITQVELVDYKQELERGRDAFQDSGRAVQSHALQEVEMERETEFQVQSTRQVKKPKEFDALKMGSVHADLQTFVATGALPPHTAIQTHAFEAMAKTGVGRKYEVNAYYRSDTASRLLVSIDFLRTVAISTGEINDSYLVSKRSSR
jgi:hypothetical protein